MTEAHTHIDAALFDSMSAELQTWPQWVIWKHEQHPGEPKPRKVPYSPRGHRAKTNRSVTWGTFAEALAAYQRGGFDGIGFVFTASDPFAGIDLDGCRDPNTGRLEPWGAEIVRALNSYTEASPSGAGVHIIIKAKLPPGERKKGKVEMYDSGRFFTMTADHTGGTPTTIEDRQIEIENLHARIFGKPHAKQANNKANRKKTSQDLDRVKEALTHVPANDYNVWLRAGMALHGAGDENFNCWVEWSKTCPEKFDLDVCQQKWRSFHAERESGVTLATIVQLAKDAGWKPSSNGRSEAPWPTDEDAPRGETHGETDDEAENRRYTDQERPVEDEAKLRRGEYAPVIICAQDVEPEEVRYLWYPYLPLGKVGLLGGDPGTGKTYVVASLATSLSLGQWPFYIAGKDNLRERSHTLIFSTEDSTEDTLVPRLIGLGADRSFVHFQGGKTDWKGTLHRVVLDDTDIITRSIKQVSARLVVFDPFQGFLPGKTKMNDMETVRPVLTALIRAAKETACHILLLGHLSKAKQDTIGYKFLGSVDWFAAARSAMLITTNPENPAEEQSFYHVKHSLGPRAPGMRFSISEKNEPPFLWGQQTDVTAEDLFSGTAKRSSTKEDESKEFLLAELAEGARPVEDLRQAVKPLRISWRTIEEAKKKLKIRARKDGYQGPWVWELPQ